MKAEASFRVELMISNLLRWGVAFSLMLLAAGTTLGFLQSGGYGQGGGTPEDFQQLLAHPDLSLLTFSGFLNAAVHLRGEALIAPGLLLLIVTPLLRVAVSIVGFALERDRLYMAITSAVLALVLLSFALGKAG